MAAHDPSNSDTVVIPAAAHLSYEHVKLENERLWPATWQMACRREEFSQVGDYLTYDIADESIVIVLVAPDELKAYYNVCLHRGRRLTDGCGHTAGFYCRFHGWKWNLDGQNTYCGNQGDWDPPLPPESVRMQQVRVDTWGGFVFICMDPDAQPLCDYLAPVAKHLDGFELDRMRYRWRQRATVPCNWKTALEAFIESYHVIATHPQLTKFAQFDSWCRNEGLHSWHGYNMRAGGTSVGLPGDDPRTGAARWFRELYTTINATTTEVFVNAAERAASELPKDATGDDVMAFIMRTAQQEYEARGVRWPAITPQQFADAGVDWHVFPNLVILPGLAQALCYRARPFGSDPDKCIFEVFVIEFFKPSEEPDTQWVDAKDLGKESWPLVLTQDFANMPEVQKGMKSRGFPGARPSPSQELPVIAFHRNLAKFIGKGQPVQFT